MAVKRVFISPGDTLDIRFMEDPTLPSTIKEWSYQLHPQRMLITLSPNTILYSDPMYSVARTSAGGRVLKYLQ